MEPPNFETAGRMINCPQCQKSSRPAAKFCDGCGLALKQDAAPTKLYERETLPLMTSSADSLLGRVIHSKYEILELIAAGGMGRVYRARRLHIGDDVAIKLLVKKYVADRNAVERFRREAQAAARIHHRNVVVIHDFGEDDSGDTPAFIVMELVRGIPLKVLLMNEGRLSLERTLKLMREVCRGVGAGHQLSVIHRDIKPDNIIIQTDEEGRETVKVVDFGLAKLREEIGIPSLTQVGIVLGTPYYMAPEQCRGDALSIRSDVYSLGVMAYEMLTGAVPFRGDNVLSVCIKHENGVPPPFPESLDIPAAVEAVVMRALAKDPGGRQEDALAFARELLEAATEGGPDEDANVAANAAKSVAPEEVSPAAGEPLIPNLTKAETLILARACEKLITRDRDQALEVESVLEQAAQGEVDKDTAVEALESLLAKGYVEIRSGRAAEGFSRFSVTAGGFDAYSGTFVPGYDQVKSDVIDEIVRGGGGSNMALAEFVNRPLILINCILNLLEQDGSVRLSKRLGGKVVIGDVSPDLERLARASEAESDGKNALTGT